MEIHKSEYGDGKLNFHINKYGNELHIELTYPPYTDADNKNDQCRYININQESVRASDGIRIHYDYERDGFVIEQPQPRMKKISESTYESVEDWIETAFLQSWRFDVPHEQQIADANGQWMLIKS